MGSTWENETCPHCNAENWIFMGDMSDLTYPDVDGFRCWSCKKETCFEGTEDYYLTLNQDIEESAYIEDGLEKPY